MTDGIPSADDLPIVKRLEGNVGSLTIGELWFAAGTIKALYEALEYVRENLGDPVPVGRRHVARKVDAALDKARGEQ